MLYHPFTDDGHFCPRCNAGPFLCTMEDGQCDNAGICNKCVKADVYDHWERKEGNGREWE